jgi:hypothetical protein
VNVVVRMLNELTGGVVVESERFHKRDEGKEHNRKKNSLLVSDGDDTF